MLLYLCGCAESCAAQSNSDEAGLVLLQHTAADPSTGLITAQSLISEGNETVSMKTYLFEDNVNVRLRLEDVTDGDFIELTAVTGSAGQPETLIWDFADAAGLDHGNTYSKASLYFETAQPIIFDDVQFYGATTGGWQELSRPEALIVPEGMDDATVRGRLLNEFDLEVGAGLGELAGKQWRIGLMGSSSNDVNINRCLRAFEAVLR